MKNILNNFRLNKEKEDYQSVVDTIDKGVVFKGTNLWILVFAIFIASLGLNVNSTAVIIGAMLVSPLMGPIMGLGLGIAINDLTLLKKSLFNYLFAAGVSLVTSTLYFSISPLSDEHSEILARTSPNIYDVLIALFGGFAGILATSSKQKGNVIPGVAIATALMPPLCTAGFGLATLKLEYFFGAFYLFIINTVFIALATLLTIRFLKFPYKELPNEEAERKSKRIIWGVVLITLLPSIYFGYDIVQRNNFEQTSEKFITIEAVFPNDYLLQKTIDSKKRTITLTYGGQYIEKTEIEKLRAKLPNYDLHNVSLEIRQGFAYLNENKTDEKSAQLTSALDKKEKQIQDLLKQIDSLNSQKKLGKQVFKELKAQYPIVKSCIMEQVTSNSDTFENNVWVSIINSEKKLTEDEKQRISDWLKIRVNTNNLIINFKE